MKRRAVDRGAGESSAQSKALCTGIAGTNSKRAGPFILGEFLQLETFREGEMLFSH